MLKALGGVELWVKAAFMIKASDSERKCASELVRLSVVQIT